MAGATSSTYGVTMQYLYDNQSSFRKGFDIGWRALLLAVVTIALSLAVSFGIVNLVEMLLS